MIRKGDMVEEIATGNVGIVFKVIEDEGIGKVYYEWVELGTGLQRFTRAARICLVHGTIHIDLRVYDLLAPGATEAVFARWAQQEFEEGL